MKKFAIVFFFEPCYETGTITPAGNTGELPIAQALTAYAETPNPASQLVEYDTPEEKTAGIELLNRQINNREWLNKLFACI